MNEAVLIVLCGIFFLFGFLWGRKKEPRAFSLLELEEILLEYEDLSPREFKILEKVFILLNIKNRAREEVRSEFKKETQRMAHLLSYLGKVKDESHIKKATYLFEAAKARQVMLADAKKIVE